MMPSSLPTEVILSASHRSIGQIHFDWTPQPGSYLELAGQTYTVLERHHRYQLKAGRYHLRVIALYVQIAPAPTERTLVGERWVLGNITCRFNARSELIRCAVNPGGPCDRCRFYEPIL